ncbi:hypothetical protein E2C01_094940 [Portunus trituberculatus]|uniref:Uncharacterized protein n=1 Tax=Portunus trituberculatus TaxID=210409 RepID=A0A5B7JNI1_PORTR|nr:hypothetical protein [Portunus trituberculatus]
MASAQSQSENSHLMDDQSQHLASLGANQSTVFKGERQYGGSNKSSLGLQKTGQQQIARVVGWGKAGGTPTITGLWTPPGSTAGGHRCHHQYVLPGGLIVSSGRGETLVAGGRDEELESEPLESGGAEVGLAVQGPQQWVTALQQDRASQNKASEMPGEA